MEKKSFKFELKELNEDGTFEGYASTFNKVDHGGDTVEPGAFAKTLKENDQFPVHWYHNYYEPVGGIHGEEDEKGLFVKGYLILEVQRAKELYALMRKKVVNMLSIGYDVIKQTWDEEVRILKEIKLWEVSIVTWGMDQEAFITDVKMEGKPLANEHSARIKDPDLFNDETFRRKKDGTIYGSIKVPDTAAVIWGKLKEHDEAEDNPIPQAMRFPVKDWTVAQAKKWLKDNKVAYEKFEPAKKSIEGILDPVLSLDTAKPLSYETSQYVIKAIEALKSLPLITEPSADTQDEGKPTVLDSKSEMIVLSAFNQELKKLNKSIGGQ